MVKTDIDAYYEGKTTREMIRDVRRWLGVAPDDENRYPDVDVVDALNLGQERFVKLTGCLYYPAVVILKEGQQNYRLPYNSMLIKSARYYHSYNPADYKELKIVYSSKYIQRLDPQMRGTRGTPTYLFPSYRAGNLLRFGLSPIPSRNGEAFDSERFGLLMSVTGFSNVGNITGFHKPSYDPSDFLVDADGRDMVGLGLKEGYPVNNVTDGSYGIITSIQNADAINDRVDAQLTGGTNNNWRAGDEFMAPMGEYGVVLDAVGDEVYTTTSYYGTVLEIAGGSGNLILDIVRKPLAMSPYYDSFICELPAAYHEAPIAFAVYWLGRGAFKGIMQAEKAAEAIAIFQTYINEYSRPDELAEESDAAIEDRSYEYLL